MDEPSTTDVETDLAGSAGQPARGPLSYATAAISIARLDTEAMARVSRDPMALVYGAVAFVITAALSIVLRSLISGVVPNVLTIAIAPIVGLIASAVTTGIVHLLARVMFQASGTYVGLLRVLWLGSIVSLFGVIPLAGAILSGIWSLLITMVTFQEVDGIERLQALGLSIGVALGFSALVQFLGQ